MARLSIRTAGLPERIEKITTEAITIGRGSQSDLVVKDPHLSRQHCRLERAGADFRVVDLGSRNGVKINGERISHTYTLFTGDLIQIGRTQILYVAETQEDAKDEAVDAGQTIMLDEVTAGLDEEAPEPSQDRPMRFVLQYTRGKHRRFLPLTKGQLTIGRHKSCGLILRDSSVSSCHAALDFRNGQYVIHDLGSTNGVKVNGKKIESAVLKPGTRLRLGNVVLGFKEVVTRGPTVKVNAVSEEPASTPPALPALAASPAASASTGDEDGPDLPLEEPEAFEEELVEETVDDSDGTPRWGSPSVTEDEAAAEPEAAPPEAPAEADAPPPIAAAASESGGVAAASDAEPSPPVPLATDSPQAAPAVPAPAKSPPPEQWLPGAPEGVNLDVPEWVQVKFESGADLPKPVLPEETPAAPEPKPEPETTPAPSLVAPEAPPASAPPAAPAPAAATTAPAPQDEAPAHKPAAAASPAAGKSDAELKQIMSDLDGMLDDFTPSPDDTAAPSEAPAPDLPAAEQAKTPSAPPDADEPEAEEEDEASGPAADDEALDEAKRERRILIRIVMLVILVVGLMLIFLVPWGRIFAPPKHPDTKPTPEGAQDPSPDAGEGTTAKQPTTPMPRVTTEGVEREPDQGAPF